MFPVPESHIEAMLSSLNFKYCYDDDAGMVVCQAELPNGFEVGIGSSQYLIDGQFDHQKAMEYALDEAVAIATETLWRLESYLLKVTGKLSVVAGDVPDKCFKCVMYQNGCQLDGPNDDDAEYKNKHMNVEEATAFLQALKMPN